MFPGFRTGRCCRSLAHLVLISVAVSAPAARRRESETPGLAPIYAKLVGLLDARFLKPDSPILLEVKDAWQNGDCKLRAGSILKGHVVGANVSSKNDSTSRVAIVVNEAECNGPVLVPLPLTVAAIMAADPAGGHRSAPQNAQLGLLASGVDPQLMQTLSSGMAGRPGPPPPSNSAVFFEETSAKSLDSPKRISVGDVFGFWGLKLSVGTGPEQSSVLFVKGHDVSLQRETEIVLIPAALVAREAAPAPSSSSSVPAATALTLPPATTAASVAESMRPGNAPPKLPEADPEPDVESCAAPSCSIALPNATTSDAQGQKSFSLSELGYAPRSNVQLYDFDHEAALAYLGKQRLLVTFNPHQLVDRKAGTDVERIVRAAVLDTSTMRVVRMVDWPIADRNQYLWPAGNGRVLAHVGDELRVYGPDLEIERRIELRGPLAWLRVSPSKNSFAIGVILERHSTELHAQLAAIEEPEEDLEIRVLDAGLQTTMTVIRSSRSVPPTLTDEGEVQIDRQGNDRWHLVERTWNHQEHLIAHVTSACMPQISSIAPDLLFVVTCGQSAGEKYRVLRRDGSLVLQGNSSSKELGLGAHGTSPGTAFVVGIAEADRTVTPGGYFSPSDLKTEHIAVYRATDGKRIFAIHVDWPASAREAYALAPGAGELAVLSAQQISLYPLQPQ